jgi:hypothetical protein
LAGCGGLFRTIGAVAFAGPTLFLFFSLFDGGGEMAVCEMEIENGGWWDLLKAVKVRFACWGKGHCILR